MLYAFTAFSGSHQSLKIFVMIFLILKSNDQVFFMMAYIWILGCFFFLHRLELLILENTVELKGPFLCCIRHILNISFPWNFHCEPYFLLPIFDFLGSEVRILSILNVEESFNLHFLGRGIPCIYYFEFSKEDIPSFTLI